MSKRRAKVAPRQRAPAVHRGRADAVTRRPATRAQSRRLAAASAIVLPDAGVPRDFSRVFATPDQRDYLERAGLVEHETVGGGRCCPAALIFGLRHQARWAAVPEPDALRATAGRFHRSHADTRDADTRVLWSRAVVLAAQRAGIPDVGAEAEAAVGAFLAPVGIPGGPDPYSAVFDACVCDLLRPGTYFTQCDLVAVSLELGIELHVLTAVEARSGAVVQRYGTARDRLAWGYEALADRPSIVRIGYNGRSDSAGHFVSLGLLPVDERDDRGGPADAGAGASSAGEPPRSDDGVGAGTSEQVDVPDDHVAGASRAGRVWPSASLRDSTATAVSWLQEAGISTMEQVERVPTDIDAVKFALVGYVAICRFFVSLGPLGLVSLDPDARRSRTHATPNVHVVDGEPFVAIAEWPWFMLVPLRRRQALCDVLSAARSLPVLPSLSPGSLYQGGRLVFLATHLCELLLRAGVDRMHVNGYGFKAPSRLLRGALDDVIRDGVDRVGAEAEREAEEANELLQRFGVGGDDWAEPAEDSPGPARAGVARRQAPRSTVDLAVGVDVHLGRTVQHREQVVADISLVQQREECPWRQRTRPIAAMGRVNKEAFIHHRVARLTAGQSCKTSLAGLVETYVPARGGDKSETRRQLKCVSYSHAIHLAGFSTRPVKGTAVPSTARARDTQIEISHEAMARVTDPGSARYAGGERFEVTTGPMRAESSGRLWLARLLAAAVHAGCDHIARPVLIPAPELARDAELVVLRAEEAGLRHTYRSGELRGQVTAQARGLVQAVRNAHFVATPLVWHNLCALPLLLVLTLTDGTRGPGPAAYRAMAVHRAREARAAGDALDLVLADRAARAAAARGPVRASARASARASERPASGGRSLDPSVGADVESAAPSDLSLPELDDSDDPTTSSRSDCAPSAVRSSPPAEAERAAITPPWTPVSMRAEMDDLWDNLLVTGEARSGAHGGRARRVCAYHADGLTSAGKLARWAKTRAELVCKVLDDTVVPACHGGLTVVPWRSLFAAASPAPRATPPPVRVAGRDS